MGKLEQLEFDGILNDKKKNNEAAGAGGHIYHSPKPEEFNGARKMIIKKRPAEVIKTTARIEKDPPKDWYGESERKLEDLNDRGPRLPKNKFKI